MKRKRRLSLFALLLTSMGLIASPLSASAEGEPYFYSCTVMAMNTPDGVQTAPTAQVFDSNGTVPGTIESFTVVGPGGFTYSFTEDDYVEVHNFYWHAILGQPADGEYTFTVTDTEVKTATSH